MSDNQWCAGLVQLIYHYRRAVLHDADRTPQLCGTRTS